MEKEWYLFFAAEIMLNIITFVMFYIDKINHRRHPHHSGVSTHLFMTLAVLGGSLGEMLGMLLLRHKRHHREYLILLPIIFVVETIILWLVLRGYFSDTVITTGLSPA